MTVPKGSLVAILKKHKYKGQIQVSEYKRKSNEDSLESRNAHTSKHYSESRAGEKRGGRAKAICVERESYEAFQTPTRSPLQKTNRK